MLVDTHAHIHFSDYGLDIAEVLANAKAAGVEKIICVGTDHQNSVDAIEFVEDKPQCVATVGLHPHDAKSGDEAFERLKDLVKQPKVMAVGECGLDYYYEHSTKQQQRAAFRYQIELALENSKPLIFHVRDAFDDFFKVVDEYQNVRGVVHSFSSTPAHLEQALKRNFYVAFNGIMTFTKDQNQLDAAKQCPLDKMLLETDCPFLTPAPYRGKINQPSYVREIAQFLAKLRGESFEKLAAKTSANAATLFGFSL